jgi:hypothetical protein
MSLAVGDDLDAARLDGDGVAAIVLRRDRVDGRVFSDGHARI